MDALALLGPLVHPLLAALEVEVAAQAAAPLKLLRHSVVGAVPARVLHQRHRDAGVDGVLCVSSRHRLVLEQPLLPVGQRRSFLTLARFIELHFAIKKVRYLFKGYNINIFSVK